MSVGHPVFDLRFSLVGSEHVRPVTFPSWAHAFKIFFSSSNAHVQILTHRIFKESHLIVH